MAFFAAFSDTFITYIYLYLPIILLRKSSIPIFCSTISPFSCLFFPSFGLAASSISCDFPAKSWGSSLDTSAPVHLGTPGPAVQIGESWPMLGNHGIFLMEIWTNQEKGWCFWIQFVSWSLIGFGILTWNCRKTVASVRFRISSVPFFVATSAQVLLSSYGFVWK